MKRSNTCRNRKVQRGEIYYADLSPVVGCEQGGARPVLVIQNNVGNHFSPTVIIAAITGRKDKHWTPTHVVIDGINCGLRGDAVVLLEQIRTIDKQRLHAYIGQLDKESISKIDQAIAVSLSLALKDNYSKDYL